MWNYVISCCSTADLSEEHFREREISYICFHFELDGKQTIVMGGAYSIDKMVRLMYGDGWWPDEQERRTGFIAEQETFLTGGISGVIPPV